MQKNPEHHNFTLGDILGKGEKEQPAPKDIAAVRMKSEPSMPGAPMAEAKPEMAALEKAVEAGIKVALGKTYMEGDQIVLPFDVASKNREDQFQLRVSIDMEAPMAKRFKITVKNFKK
jgi:hypothetical protein